MNKNEALKLIALRFEDFRPQVAKGKECMACLYWSAAVHSVLTEVYNRPCEIVAGSTQFQFRKDDDGKSATHFSYMFEPLEAIKRISAGLFPEMHVWVESCRDLIDVTTGFQVEQMKRVLGQEWDAELIPPQFLWCDRSEIPHPRFVYSKHRVGSSLASLYLNKSMRKELTAVGTLD